jgi:hypothetical protein
MMGMDVKARGTPRSYQSSHHSSFDDGPRPSFLGWLECTVAQRYRLKLVPGRPVEPERLCVLRPRSGLPMTIRRVWDFREPRRLDEQPPTPRRLTATFYPSEFLSAQPIAHSVRDLVAMPVLEPLDQTHPDLLRDPDRWEVAEDFRAKSVERVGGERAHRPSVPYPRPWNDGAIV